MNSHHEKSIRACTFCINLKKKKFALILKKNIVFDKHYLRRFYAIVLVHKLMKLKTVKTKVIHVH